VRPVSLARFYEENPYLQDQFAILATPFPVDATAGARLQTGPVQLTAEGGYRYAPLYRYFTTASANQPYGSDLFQARYTAARIQHVGGRVALQGLEPVQASVAVTYRRGRLDAGTAIPNFAPVTGSALVSYAFADRRGLLQLTGTLEGPRFADREKTQRLPLYLDADLRARYDITETIGLELDVHNLVPSTLERWAGYPRPPLTVTAGVRLQW
jgi:outer membrane cobalamin receptor